MILRWYNVYRLYENKQRKMYTFILNAMILRRSNN